MKTIVVGMDDSTPGQVYVYVGTKTAEGSPVDRAGLTNGVLYGVKVTGVPTEDAAAGIPSGTRVRAALAWATSRTAPVRRWRRPATRPA